MRKLFITISIVIITFTTHAQKGQNAVGFGADIGVPLGDFWDLCSVGFGG